MRLSSLFLAVGLAASAGLFAVVGCSSDGDGSSSGTTESSASSSSGSASSSASSGSGSTSSSSGGAGGSEGYQSCNECADLDNGAPKNECKAQREACLKDTGCAELVNCTFFEANGGMGCQSSTKDGACCTLQCFMDKGSSMASINLFKAYDGCVYCTTCRDKMLCNADEYCKVFEGTSMCP